MSHPDPTKEYGDELPGRMKPKKLNHNKESIRGLLHDLKVRPGETPFQRLKRLVPMEGSQKSNALKKKINGKSRKDNIDYHSRGVDYYKHKKVDDGYRDDQD